MSSQSDLALVKTYDKKLHVIYKGGTTKRQCSKNSYLNKQVEKTTFTFNMNRPCMSG